MHYLHQHFLQHFPNICPRKYFPFAQLLPCLPTFFYLTFPQLQSLPHLSSLTLPTSTTSSHPTNFTLTKYQAYLIVNERQTFRQTFRQVSITSLIIFSAITSSSHHFSLPSPFSVTTFFCHHLFLPPLFSATTFFFHHYFFPTTFSFHHFFFASLFLPSPPTTAQFAFCKLHFLTCNHPSPSQLQEDYSLH